MNKVEYNKFLEAVDTVCINCSKLSEENCKHCPVRLTCDELSNKMEDLTMIKNGTFTSVWDVGYEVTTNCKVNMETKEVFDVEMAEVDDSFEQLDYEYITVDGEKHIVYNAEDGTDGLEDTDFWYE